MNFWSIFVSTLVSMHTLVNLALSMSTGISGTHLLHPVTTINDSISATRSQKEENVTMEVDIPIRRIRRHGHGGGGGRGKCLEEREERRRVALNTGKSTEYIPVCRPDGSYAAVQCHPSTRTCWCVTRVGRPIQGSSILSQSQSASMTKPNCSKYLRPGKSSTTRRSSHAKNNRKTCNYSDRSRFNVALIRTFRSEYNRYKQISAAYFDSGEGSDDTVLSWKYDNLDRNKDGLLHKNETMIFKHLVKQQIQPRPCAKNFISFCAKGDQKISRKEWLDCLRLPSVDNRSPGGIHPSQLLKPGGSSGLNGGDMHPLRSGGGIDTSEVSNCWTDRQSAMASQIRNESVIIPDCTVNGLYHKVQCAQGRTYCWCVEEESGVQIANTVVVNTVPDCNNRYSKPMKGCSGHKKQKFLADLMDLLMKKLTSSINEGRHRIPNEQRQLAVQDQAARYYFTELDINRNGVLDRNEWKIFRNETAKDKRLKKCGKKLPRHCDVNHDKRITTTEWQDCLGLEFYTPKPLSSFTSRRPVHRSNGRRNGKNPFTDILKQR